jgi:4-hydroxythreonine-4-phosphate dehydrogenase
MIKVGITHGDINGIGYEIILKTFSDPRMTELCTPVIYGSGKVSAYYRKALNIALLNLSFVNRAEEVKENKVYLLNCVSDEIKVELAKPTEQGKEAAFRALERAAADLKRGLIDALVTAPIDDCGIYPAPAEYLEQLFGDPQGGKALNILISGDLRIALATERIPFAKALPLITKETVGGQLQVFNQSLKQDFNIVRPRIAVLSLNPDMGEEEESILAPAVRDAEKQGVSVCGLYTAERFFENRFYKSFDGVLAMYYDQATAAFKILAEDNGCVYTAGLSIVRTSPAHGASYAIAGENVASEASFRQALYAALDIYRNRLAYKEATRDPLRKQYYDKGGDENIDLTQEEEVSL